MKTSVAELPPDDCPRVAVNRRVIVWPTSAKSVVKMLTFDDVEAKVKMAELKLPGPP